MRNVANDPSVGTAIASLSSAGARAHLGSVNVTASAEGDLVDVTADIEKIVTDAGVSIGLALVSVPHTTCAVIVNEDEAGVREDFRRALERLAPRTDDYVHDRAPHDEEGESPNGFAHIRAALLGAHATILPVRDGTLALGRWQRVFLAELDRARPRTLEVTVLGVSATERS